VEQLSKPAGIGRRPGLQPLSLICGRYFLRGRARNTAPPETDLLAEHYALVSQTGPIFRIIYHFSGRAPGQKQPFAPRHGKRHTILMASPVAPPIDRWLRDLAGIGKSSESDLRLLGITTVDQLSRVSGDFLYHQLCRATGARQDPCVLDTFRCAVAQARNPALPADQRNWWWWSQQRKQSNIR
jgi:hypothetical protein